MAVDSAVEAPEGSDSQITDFGEGLQEGLEPTVDESTEVPEGEETDSAPEVDAEYEDVDNEFLNQTFKVKVDGEELEVTLDEALKGYQRQADYTRKTQELASQRQQAEALSRLESALTSDFDGTVERLRQALGIPAPSPRSDTEFDDLSGEPPEVPEPIARELEEMRLWRAEQEARERQAQIDSELTQLVQQYEDDGLEAEAILQYAVNEQIPSLKTAARLCALEARDAKKREAETKRVVQRKRTAAAVQQSGGASRSTGQTGPSGKMTIEEAFMAALSES